MHMADALLAPTVAATMYVASTITSGVSLYEIKKEEMKKLPTMAVMSALVFAGQMVNFTIPGTGSSGHLCGGMMLTALLGPFSGFLSMIAVLFIQALIFADGGLMALGANVWNMAFYGCFVGYYLIYRPVMGSKIKNMRVKIILASILGCVFTLQLGAFSVCLETKLSGITELPFGAFVALMQPIHLAIGFVEGLITSAVLLFVYEARPEFIMDANVHEEKKPRFSYGTTLLVLAITVCVVGGGVSLLASQNPDGLEWSLFGNKDAGYSENLGLDEDHYGVSSDISDKLEKVQNKTSFLPDYSFKNDEENVLGTSVSGILGSFMVAILAAIICFFGGIVKKRRRYE